MDSSATYQAPGYLVTSTGLTAAQLETQFENFKRTLRFVPSAPELVFERVVANVFALTTPHIPTKPTDDGLQQSLTDLHDEISSLKHDLNDLKATIESNKQCQPDDTPGTVTVARNTPIKFTFVNSPYGLSTRAEQYDSYDGRYGAGCLWSDLGVVDNGVQFGTFNTVDEMEVGPQQQRCRPKIKFPKGFTARPTVAIWLTGIDIRCERPCHVKMVAEEITETDFEVDIISSESNVWYSLGFSWVAWPDGDAGYTWSRSDAVLYGTAFQEGETRMKFHDLPAGSRNPQRTLLAINSITMACGGTMPFLLEQLIPTRNRKICYDLKTAINATGMYILNIICITCE
ncbi:hypothetical protein Q9L58_006876 [Maublancomyces gigas]|uniref:H-type lectin domain-containing protein n=1 Tax=Discina gigas TaxID=1032678 RepID=A0ABR3GE59_9PEZI